MDPVKIAGSFGLAAGMRAADFGSGAGFFTIIMAKLVGESGAIAAIDILDSALDTLRAKAKAEGLNNIQTARSNLEVIGSSGLANDSQDMVLIANTLFQNQDKSLIINEAKRVLKPGGTLVLIDWHKGSGGFGPPDNLRMSSEEAQSFIEALGFQTVSSVDAGTFHFGLVFKKL